MANYIHNRLYFIWVTLFLLTSFLSNGQIGKYPIQNFTPEEYRAGIQNIDFAQNRDMSLFVANNLGVLEFDGNDWSVHAFQSGKKQRSLKFDKQSNRLYVGSQGDFGYFEKDWQFHSLIDLIPPNHKDLDEVWDVFLFDSNIYFCTFKKIYVYDGSKIDVIEHPNGFGRSFQVNGTLLTQTQQGDLLEIKGHILENVYDHTQEDQIIAGVIPKEDGYLLFFNSGRIELTTAFASETRYESLSRAIQGTYVNHVLQLSDTRLAISTQTAGLFLFDPQKQHVEQISTKNGLQANACLRAFQDYVGNLWVGLQSGIALIHINSPIRFIGQEINLEGSGYEAFEMDFGSYYSTSNGIYYLARGETQSTFLTGTEGPAYGIQEIAGKIYAGHHTGLFQLNKNRAERIASTEGLWQVKQLRSQPQYAIAGTYSGLILFKIDETKNLILENKINGFNESSRFFEENNEGKIIVGQYYKGLYELTLNGTLDEVDVEYLSKNYDLPIQQQIVLSKIENELYIATNEGLYKFDQATNKIQEAGNLSTQIGAQPVYLLKQDRVKNIHIVGENSVGFFKQISANNHVFIPSSLFKMRYKLNNDLLHASSQINNGVMFSANQGFLFYNPDLEKHLKLDNPLVISRVYSVSQDLDFLRQKPFEPKPEKLQDLNVDQQSKVLQFKVQSFQYQDAGNQQFRYKLDGFENDYGSWTNSKTKEYSNLKEGEYEFSVQTKNHLGEITTSLPLNITVKPPFIRSPLAKALFILLALTIIYLIWKFQKKRYQVKAKLIEEKKQNELAEKSQKLLEFEEQKQKELHQIHEAKIESELRHLNNLLAASTMNLVVKNEFIETIKEELKEVRKKGKNEETKQALERIEKEIDTTLRLQEDWEQFEYHFDKVHGDFLTRLRQEFLDLSPNDQKLCAFLRLNLNTKEIANLMSISLRGVEVARYRLRKKLGLHKGENLSKYILEY